MNKKMAVSEKLKVAELMAEASFVQKKERSRITSRSTDGEQELPSKSDSS